MKNRKTTTEARLEEFVLYVVGHRPTGCSVDRVHGVLFQADFWHYSDVGRPLTGQSYVLRNGRPRSPGVREAIERLRQRGVLERRGDLLLAQREADLDAFEAAELAFVEAVRARIAA